MMKDDADLSPRTRNIFIGIIAGIFALIFIITMLSQYRDHCKKYKIHHSWFRKSPKPKERDVELANVVPAPAPRLNRFSFEPGAKNRRAAGVPERPESAVVAPRPEPAVKMSFMEKVAEREGRGGPLNSSYYWNPSPAEGQARYG